MSKYFKSTIVTSGNTNNIQHRALKKNKDGHCVYNIKQCEVLSLVC